MKTLSLDQSLAIAGGFDVQTGIKLMCAKIGYDFVASAYAGALGSLLVRNTLSLIGLPIMLNPSLVIGITMGALGGGFSQNVPALGHNMITGMIMGGLSGLASYTTNTTNLIF